MNLKPSLRIPVLLLATNLGLAAQKPPVAKSAAPAAVAQDKADLKPMVAAQSQARATALKAQKTRAKATVKRVDINGATKAELETIPGITEAYADKIIAGRPYLTQIHLVTHGVLPSPLYETIKKRIYAKQNFAKH